MTRQLTLRIYMPGVFAMWLLQVLSSHPLCVSLLLKKFQDTIEQSENTKDTYTCRARGEIPECQMPLNFLRSRKRGRNPSKRPRALTSPLSEPAKILWRRQKTADQTQSILFKLPLEIRELIYSHALAYAYQPYSPWHFGSDPPVRIWGSKNPLAILLTCRQV